MFAAAVPEWTFHVEVWLLIAALAGWLGSVLFRRN